MHKIPGIVFSISVWITVCCSCTCTTLSAAAKKIRNHRQEINTMFGPRQATAEISFTRRPWPWPSRFYKEYHYVVIVLCYSVDTVRCYFCCCFISPKKSGFDMCQTLDQYYCMLEFHLSSSYLFRNGQKTTTCSTPTSYLERRAITSHHIIPRHVYIFFKFKVKFKFVLLGCRCGIYSIYM
jgi:hypothetical protein